MRQALIDWIGSLALGWFWRQIGVTKWIKTRLIRVPQAALPALATEAATRAGVADTLTATEAQAFWRGVEGVVADAVDGTLRTQVERLVARVKV